MTSSVNAMSMPHYQRRAFVASRLKDARLNSGLTQRYCRIENGKTEPSVVQLATLSGLYGLSVLWLLGMPSFIVNGVKNYFSSSSS
jgi:transcriptional regulator with XRE-family HTH domain